MLILEEGWKLLGSEAEGLVPRVLPMFFFVFFRRDICFLAVLCSYLFSQGLQVGPLNLTRHTYTIITTTSLHFYFLLIHLSSNKACILYSSVTIIPESAFSVNATINEGNETRRPFLIPPLTLPFHQSAVARGCHC